MRIIGGKYKGRNLTPFNCEKIRPTQDKARESLFNILREKAIGCSFLDLFGGTGAVGIEAYSRGAESVIITDAFSDSLAVAKKNLDKIGNPDGIKLVRSDALVFLENPPQTFDIIFVDPPYKSEILPTVLKKISDGNALNAGGVVVAETETPYSGETFSLKIIDERKYGRTRFTFMQREKQ